MNPFWPRYPFQYDYILDADLVSLTDQSTEVKLQMEINGRGYPQFPPNYSESQTKGQLILRVRSAYVTFCFYVNGVTDGLPMEPQLLNEKTYSIQLIYPNKT